MILDQTQSRLRRDLPGSAVLTGYLPVLPAGGAAASACREALAKAGCEQIVEERAGGVSDCTHPELRTLLPRLDRGDILVLPQLRSMGNSLAEVVRHVQSLTTSEIGLRSLGDALDAAAWHVQTLTAGVARHPGLAVASDAAASNSGAHPATADSRMGSEKADVRSRGRPVRLSGTPPAAHFR